MPVDLHTHTYFSDGTMSPEDLLQKAENESLTALAVTDHDEIGANYIAQQYAQSLKLEFVSGVEFSIDIALPGTAHLHLLGLFLEIENDELKSVLNDLRNARQTRAGTIIKKLQDYGLDVSENELDVIVGQGSAGRPHVAQLLMDKNVVDSVWEAFHKFLSKDRPGYVPKKKLKLQTAIDLIHKAKGLAILAHPISLKQRTYKDTEAFLKELKSIGLDGVEAYYASHTRNFTSYLLNAAKRNNLLISGGSDFHGSIKPDTELGIGRGNLSVPDQVFFDLKNAVSK
ncbi:MAG: PHP domain-containing protein [Calditrichaeota bacterium]|nr:MAG: PHP domain-containing protein [Calditrichota bacterium]MBL1207696.1 PHP domain-containing protein [Calditrichota bacterium]NOG47531.1 PHP domain-containing protein [Calditrichota bacterium]